jgi:CheY-like chemotaxis protein/HPt (histidine-containing phosphotransfer) domain-containing protein
MNGTIEVTTAPGADNAVWFVVPLPIAADVAPAARVAPAAAMPARRILVADDNRMNQIVIDGLLRRDGHDVVLTSDGAQALAALQTQNFDLVFMDLQMPTMDGLAATQAIRSANERINAVPIVALTANTRTQEIDMCRAAGMNDYLAKPIDPQLLRSTIAKWTPDADAPPSVRPTSNEQRTSAPLSAGPIVENKPGSSTAASIVAEILDGERRAFSEFLGMAIDVIEVDLQRIARSIQTHDVTVAAEAAHRLTGTCGSIHAARLRMVSSSIEEAARAESWSAAGGLYEELRTWVGVLKSFSGSLPK